jgi:hypothetical protein
MQRPPTSGGCSHVQCNLEIYVNDIIVKTRRGDNLTLGLEETFSNL